MSSQEVKTSKCCDVNDSHASNGANGANGTNHSHNAPTTNVVNGGGVDGGVIGGVYEAAGGH